MAGLFRPVGLKQRIHGVVDVYGNRKPSFEELRRELSPVAQLELARGSDGFACTLRMRNSVPAYRAEGYKLRWLAYGHGGQPMEQHENALPPLSPGAELALTKTFQEKNIGRVRVDVVRPTGFSAASAEVPAG